MPATKRKVPAKGATKKQKADQVVEIPPKATQKRPNANPVEVVVKNAQTNEAFHIKYIKELQQSYLQVRKYQTIIILRSLSFLYMVGLCGPVRGPH